MVEKYIFVSETVEEYVSAVGEPWKETDSTQVLCQVMWLVGVEFDKSSTVCIAVLSENGCGKIVGSRLAV